MSIIAYLQLRKTIHKQVIEWYDQPSLDYMLLEEERKQKKKEVKTNE